MSCDPFDPRQAEAFMLVGTLRHQDGQYESVALEEIDVEASRQLVDGEWQPIEGGRVSFSLRDP
jgi:hypothetical protein